ncbi:MAG: ABC transporter permease [Planctomycetales bacterium]|nr:ABC transporter permease [Planctomycetales bacterium]
MSLAGIAASDLMRRNRLRTALTLGGVAFGVLAFILIQTVISAWEIGVTTAAKDRTVTRHKVTFVMSLPKRYVEEIRRTPGVKQATWSTWFGGKNPLQEREFFMAIGVEPESWLDVYDEVGVAPEERSAWIADRQGALVGDVLAKKFGWKKGDTVKLTSNIFPGEWEYRIHAIYQPLRKSADRSMFVFDWDYLNQSVPERQREQVGWITSRVKTGTDPAALSKALDAKFEENEVQTLSQDEASFQRSFLGMMSAILGAMNVVSLVILGIMALILGNTVAMGVRERLREYAVLRAIGFRSSHVTRLVLGEAAALGAAGGLLGLAIAVPIVGGLGKFLEENMAAYFSVFRLDPGTAGLALAIAVGLGAAAGLIPARGASRLPVVEALRRVA